ncbi:hypothetical protein TanjilG_29058 [Lupinus angustifolius]|uniref:Uncharacterized protein n=1 Tax=Lupinus angustifolius TaxID=3871 RepID=A0A4P1RTL6_LUPAN|nr:PREDICTED: uncharacterized protein LOC109362807 [Lupinus angustifolius]XP_019464388.1 PREDICTED: uncharacterized protein LOC109362807 [Lupinus angustifolius]OIW17708.1 hypothetical protein TanjilG_29058 [Lupinus angustifolius]
MDDSEKLLALKKAYADIILNTAKEAAARVMASERKATRFHQELLSTKDEALRMLLRLKQMLDSKVKEAELTSLSQQKKIDVLEAQLQEAEDIVSNLRAELREAESKLENLTNHQMYPPVEQNVEGKIETQESCLQDNRVGPCDGSVHPVPDSHAESVSISDTRNPTVNGTNDSSKFGVSHDHTNNCYIHNLEFPSVVIRNKEPELYRNGCTQRIRASERSLFDGNMSVSGNLDNAHDETSVRVHEEGKAMPVTTNAVTDSIREKEKPDELKVVKADADPVKVPSRKRRRNLIKVLRSRLRAKRDRKRNKASNLADAKVSPCVWDNNYSSRVNSSIECENEAQKNLVRVREEDKTTTVTTNAKVDTIFGKEKVDKLDMVKTDADPVKASVLKKRRLTMRVHPGQVNKTNEASYLSDAKCSTCVLDNNDLLRVDSSLVCEKEALKDVMSPLAEVPVDKTDTTVKSESRDCIGKEGLLLNACSARSKIKDDKELLGKSDLTRQESLSTEGLEVSSSRADVKPPNGSPEKPDPKASDFDEKVSCQPANNKFLKYTFQRKRKKEPVTSADADCSLENDSLKKSAEKQNGRVEPQKSCPMTESSRESRRLAQVARQLISLSEKKWWQ